MPEMEKVQVETLIAILKWAGSVAVATWVTVKFFLKTGFMAGEEKRKHDELIGDVEELKIKQGTYLTRQQHDDISKICTSELEHMIDLKIHATISDLRYDMSTMNGNICRILGALNIEVPENDKYRRKTDIKEKK
jgi:hypothetical protein